MIDSLVVIPPWRWIEMQVLRAVSAFEMAS